MGASPSYRETNRTRLRESLLGAARTLTVERGWENVRMADVAGAAGVSRQTVYNEFDGRDGLAGALAAREIELFAADVRRQLFAHGADVRAAAEAAIRQALTDAAGNPLVRAILTGAGELLPYLTTHADLVVDAAGAVIREWAAQYLPGVGEARLAVAADAVVRLTISHIVMPSGPPAETAAMLADVLTRLLRD
jgi:AcrR family transcriptional regulator